MNLFLICNRKKESLFFFWYGGKKDEKSRYSEKKLCVLQGVFFEYECMVYASHSSDDLILGCLGYVLSWNCDFNS